MSLVYLGLALHNHQPVGNFPWVFEEAYHQAYLPLLEALERHPGVRLSLHYSGPLLDWLMANQPGFLERLAILVARGQVEMMLGAYYEPILPAIPDADKVGQIEMMARFLKDRLSTRATGFWLAERVWEPHLPRPLAQAGVQWTVVDDTHFLLSGWREEELRGYFMVEEEGYAIRVFPSLKKLRYLIPWRPVEEVLTFLKEWSAGGGIAVMGDDGEKFGVWPGTYRHCWQEGWMEGFFSALEKAGVQTIPLGEYAARFPPAGRAYLPTASYDEMMEWALPWERSLELARLRKEMEGAGRAEVARWLQGGFWRNFFAKYPEADLMHKVMLRVHRKVYQAGAPREALEELWRGQCNCPYWHGVFGGLYLADVRSANWSHLVRAESIADARLHPEGGWLGVEAADLDLDREEELLVEGEKQCLYLHPGRGGGIFLWELKDPPYNLGSTIARRPEAYHHLLSPAPGREEGVSTIHAQVRLKEGSLPARFPYDSLPRWSLLEHFLPQDFLLGDFAAAAYADRGDFAPNPFKAEWHQESQGLRLCLERRGSLTLKGKTIPLRLKKEIFVPRERAGFTVDYYLEPQEAFPEMVLFLSEWNLNLLGGKNPQAFFLFPCLPTGERGLDSTGELPGVDLVTMVNHPLGIRLDLRLSPPARLWRFPVESFSSSEAGVERVYQGTCLVLLYPLDLSQPRAHRFSLRWERGTPPRPS